MEWCKETEILLLQLRDKEGKKFKEIADMFNISLSSVKHKYNRLKQSNNEPCKHHPIEKTIQIEKYIHDLDNINVLETHSGYGNLTKVYQSYAKKVVSYDISQDKVNFVNDLNYGNVVCEKKDSLREIYRHCYIKSKFNVIDIDPYGMPSRYFPHVFELIDNGIMFITIPKYGCQMINKIMLLHLENFYNFKGGDNKEYLNCILNCLIKQAMQTYRICKIIEVLDVGNVYRVVLKINKGNAMKIVGY